MTYPQHLRRYPDRSQACCDWRANAPAHVVFTIKTVCKKCFRIAERLWEEEQRRYFELRTLLEQRRMECRKSS